MASSKSVKDGRPMSASELPEPDADTDVFGSTNGCKTPDWKAPTYRDDVHYNMSHKRRGKLIIFNHKNYTNEGMKAAVREGTDVDKARMKDVFTRIKFNVDVCDDFNAADVIDKLDNEARDEAYYSESDCLVVTMMTHGEEDDLIWAKDTLYKVETLWEAFMGNSCLALAGKPKIFIVQACRGTHISGAVQFDENKVETDGITVQPNTMRYSIPSEADILIAYSSYAGKAAHRHPANGTWFIQELCEELEQTGHTDDFLSILTKVNRRVAHNYGNMTCKQMPTIQSTLTRKIYLAGTSASLADDFALCYDEKLEEILKAVRELRPVEPRSFANKVKARPGDWDSIKPNNRSFDMGRTSDDQIVKVAKAVKLLLADKNQKMDANVRVDGATILNLVAVWGSLSHDQRCFAYGRLDTFLRLHGKEWEYMGMVSLPLLGVENRRRHSTTTQVTTDYSRCLDRRSTKKKTK